MKSTANYLKQLLPCAKCGRDAHFIRDGLSKRIGVECHLHKPPRQIKETSYPIAIRVWNDLQEKINGG